MSLEKKIDDNIIKAMKEKDSLTLETLRAVKTAIKNHKVSKKSVSDLSDDEVISVMQKQLKQRSDAIEMYKTGNRPELVEKETNEYNIIMSYLPKFATEDDMIEVIQSINASSMGELMKYSRVKLLEKGLMIDGKALSTLINAHLNK